MTARRHSVRELSSQERAAAESMLGRPLASDESIEIRAYQPHPAPTDAQRGEAAGRLALSMDIVAKRFDARPPDEVEAEIDAACDAVRRGA